MRIAGMPPIDPTRLGSVPTPASGPASEPGAPGAFGRLLDQTLGQVVEPQLRADQAVRDVALGRSDNLHGALLSVAQADLAFRLVLEIRNRLTEAYQEIMRMQV